MDWDRYKRRAKDAKERNKIERRAKDAHFLLGRYEIGNIVLWLKYKMNEQLDCPTCCREERGEKREGVRNKK
jgi:hypothetical protein